MEEEAITAREALLFQENQMEKVVEESKRLQLEAEENSKVADFKPLLGPIALKMILIPDYDIFLSVFQFQEFIMDQGRAIDVL